MEFPELGSHCSQSDCNQLDFLPVKCDACGNKYCSSHWQYTAHSCPKSHLRNVQVPVCPLCDQPVPSTRGVVPDIAVSAHIDRDCKSDPAVKKRIYTNRCSMKGCKQKELIRICCDDCRQNYCLKHRHPQVRYYLPFYNFLLRFDVSQTESTGSDTFKFEFGLF